VVLLDVQVPRHWLQRAERGLWTCGQVIAPARLRVCESGDAVAASPITTEYDPRNHQTSAPASLWSAQSP
jgi:hypothetical protein